MAKKRPQQQAPTPPQTSGSGSLTDWLTSLIDKHREALERDIATLPPRERVAAIMRLISFVQPKPIAVKEFNVTGGDKTLEERLAELCREDYE